MKVKITGIHKRDAFYKHPNKNIIIGSIGEATIFEKSCVDDNYLTIDFKLDDPTGIEYGDTNFFFVAVKIEEVEE